MTKDNTLLWIAGLILAGTVLFNLPNQKFTILPELDNRITYFDKNTDTTQVVRLPDSSEHRLYETDKFNVQIYVPSGAYGESTFSISDESIVLNNCAGQVQVHPKKDFSRLNTFIRAKTSSENVEGILYLSGYEISVSGSPATFEIKPNNLDIRFYDIFKNGEFIKRLDLGTKKLEIQFIARGGETGRSWSNCKDLMIDYIKYIPPESFTIMNDEVWVKDVRKADSIPVTYTFGDLEWEMIGYHSEIRPATIRDLTTQTEVSAPQIYINLINNKPTTIQPNTVHTFFYRTKWVDGLDGSCQGDLDKAQVKQPDGKWKCESYVKETPIIQQCQVKSDCPILPDCEAQKDLVSCNNNLCDFTAFSPACRNQLITYQEKVTEIENTKFVPIPSGTNSFFCFFDKTKASCKVGEKSISVTAPSYVCSLPSGSELPSNADACWKTTLSFDGKTYDFKSSEKNTLLHDLRAEVSIGASLRQGEVRDNWGILGKFTLPDNFLDIKAKDAGDKFVLQNSNEPVTFIITNNLGFGIDGGYTLQTQNLALQGGAVLKNENKGVFLNKGDNEITYNFETKQLGTITDLISAYGKLMTDREYLMKSSSDGNQKFLVLTKEVKTDIPPDLEEVQPIVIEKLIIAPQPQISTPKPSTTPVGVYVVGAIGIIALLWWWL